LSLVKPKRRTLVAGIMLVAFAARAFIPTGFMPASGQPFSLEICREGLPTDMFAHVEPSDADSMSMPSMSMPASHHHSGSPSQGEHCVFGTACGAGPAPHLKLPNDLPDAPKLGEFALASIPLPVRVVHLPQPRAPPSQLS